MTGPSLLPVGWQKRILRWTGFALLALVGLAAAATLALFSLAAGVGAKAVQVEEPASTPLPAQSELGITWPGAR